MKLVALEFSEFRGEPREWVLEGASFVNINLIVGKNASGKTRLLNVIKGLAGLLSGARRELYTSGQYKAVFELNKTERFIYELVIKKKKVIHEKFLISGKVLLSRKNDGAGYIWAEQLKKRIRYQVPTSELAAVYRRDAIQHPYLEYLYEWAVSVKHYLFGSELGKRTIMLAEDLKAENTEIGDKQDDTEEVIKIFRKGIERFTEKFHKNVIQDMQSLGYDCEQLGLISTSDIKVHGVPAVVMYVQEADLKSETIQLHMSQGMFRALSLVVQLNYHILARKPLVILIDDIGEGMDYSRSTSLISILIKKAERHKFQLIMTTNDRFVMNGVPLEYWSLIDRKGSLVSVINPRNTPKIFEDYQYVGLNNFEFFSTDFFRKGLQ